MENRKEVKKILIISFSGMGDVLLFTPALHLLRQMIPCAKITILVKSEAAGQVLIGNPDIDNIEVFDPKSANIFKNFWFYWKQHKNRYDLSISTFPALTALNNLSTRVIGAKLRWTFRPYRVGSLAFLQNRIIPYQHGQHRIIYNLQLVENVIHYLGVHNYRAQKSFRPFNLSDTKLFYYTRAEEKNFADQFFQELKKKGSYQTGPSYKNPFWIGMHPGSGSDQPFKRWSEEKFATLASMLQNNFGAQILLFGGPEELHISESIASQMSISPTILAGRMSLRHMAAIMERCELFISNDSGLMHLAVALGTQTIGIFGPTDETNTAPIGRKNLIVLLSHLPCKPKCRERFLLDKHCPYNFRCLKELEVNRVLNSISRLYSF